MDENNVLNEENSEQDIDDIPVIPSDWAYPKIVQQTITFGDGTIINGMVLRSGIANEILLFPEDIMPMLDLITLLSDPVRTSHIEGVPVADETASYDGYTRIAGISTDADGKYIVQMGKPIE